jgi:hypothetical protein
VRCEHGYHCGELVARLLVDRRNVGVRRGGRSGEQLQGRGTQLYLDYDNAGTRFPYPIVPISVNRYGRHIIARRGQGGPTSPAGPASVPSVVTATRRR